MQSGHIDHPIMSFYTSTSGNQSYIKFGSMDKTALEGNFSLIGTTNNRTWSLNVINASIGDLALPIGSFMSVEFDPMLPYIYIPENHWTIFKDLINQTYGSAV